MHNMIRKIQSIKDEYCMADLISLGNDNTYFKNALIEILELFKVLIEQLKQTSK